eukprot:2638287-Alexandrium_andersonii.AAC.1
MGVACGSRSWRQPWPRLSAPAVTRSMRPANWVRRNASAPAGRNGVEPHWTTPSPSWVPR